MYDDETIGRALELLSLGLSPREVSRRMGGRPGHAVIRKWARGELPEGRRRPRAMYLQGEKVRAVERVEAGEDYREVAAELGCAPTTLLTWRRLRAEGGDDALRTSIDDVADRA